MSQSKRDDRLDALLDSLSADSELERKMSAFSHTRNEESEQSGPVLTARDNREPEQENEPDVPDFPAHGTRTRSSQAGRSHRPGRKMAAALWYLPRGT